MNAFRKLLDFIAAQYDKLITAVVVVVLLGSGMYVGIKLGTQGADEAAFKKKIANYVPTNPHAEVVDVSPFERAEKKLSDRPLVAAWSNSLFVPETRCWCVECRLPIALTADVCPFCKAVQDSGPPPADLDSDADGMPDAWEENYGLNPRDPDDAGRDIDRDGWTNLEEFRFDTDPTNSADHPDYIGKLRIKRIEAQPFKLLFKSVLTLPGGSKKFAVNTRKNGRTYFAKLGEEVEGFVLHDYKVKSIDRPVGRSGVTVKEDVSELTLKRGKKLVILVRGKRVSYEEYRADLVFLLDGSRYRVKQGDTIKVKDVLYKVMTIDIEKQSIVIKQLLGRKKTFVICKAP